MKLILEWPDGNEIRKSEMELSDQLEWPEIQYGFKELVKKAYKYSGNRAPEGLLEKGEIL